MYSVPALFIFAYLAKGLYNVLSYTLCNHQLIQDCFFARLLNNNSCTRVGYGSS